MYRSAQVANDSLHPFRTEQGIRRMRCNEETYEKKKSYRLANTGEVQEMQETSNTRNVKGGGGG